MKKKYFYWILVLFLCGGVAVSYSDFGIDIDGDNKTGLQEAIYILKMITGMGTQPDTGKVTGFVDLNSNISDTTIFMIVNGEKFSTKAQENGSFILEVYPVKRDQGFNIVFKNGTMAAYHAVIFDLPNLRVDLGTITLYESYKFKPRIIKGKVLDNLTENGLSLANVSIKGIEKDLSTQTYSNGEFILSPNIADGCSYCIEISKDNYLTSSSVKVFIDGYENYIDQNPVHLYLKNGSIIGIIKDDQTNEPIAYANVSVIDSMGNNIISTTDRDGKFVLLSEYFYLGNQYQLNVEKNNYSNGIIDVTINMPGENFINEDGIFSLKIKAEIGGIVESFDGKLLSDVEITAKDSQGNNISVKTKENGEFILSSTDFIKNATYTVFFRHSEYETVTFETSPLIAGLNSLGKIIMHKKTSREHVLIGNVVDAWDKNIKLAANVSITDNDGIVRSAICNSETGDFEINGKFLTGLNYSLNVSFNEYTGENQLDKSKINVNISETSPQDIGEIQLFPIGVRVNINGQAKSFSKYIKQSNEKFLTEKTGFTLSARDRVDLNSASCFYIHTDDLDNPLPNTPGNVNSSFIPVNGNRSSGSFAYGTDADTRTKEFNIKRSIMYHFFVSDPGSFLVKLYSNINSNLDIILYNKFANQIGQGNGISGLSATIDDIGWYFVKISCPNDNVYGEFEIEVTGTSQLSGNIGDWSTNDLILSYYDQPGSSIFIAGNNESGSEGNIKISKMTGIGDIVRGSFSGTLRAINTEAATINVTNGYFNIIRSE